MLEINDQNFQDEVRSSKGLVIVDCWAPWCGPCKALGPVLEGLDTEMSDVKFGKMNVDENSIPSREFNVASIPTMLVFKDGEYQNSIVGFMSKEILVNQINQFK